MVFTYFFHPLKGFAHPSISHLGHPGHVNDEVEEDRERIDMNVPHGPHIQIHDW